MNFRCFSKPSGCVSLCVYFTRRQLTCWKIGTVRFSVCILQSKHTYSLCVFLRTRETERKRMTEWDGWLFVCLFVCVGIKSVTRALFLFSLIFHSSVIILFRSFPNFFLTWIHKNIFKNMSIILWIVQVLFEILKLLPLSRYLIRSFLVQWHFMKKTRTQRNMLWTENKKRKCREMRHEGSHDSKSQNLLIYRCARLVDSLRRSRFWVNAYLCLYAERRFKKNSLFFLRQTNANTHSVNEQAKSTNKKLLIKNTKGWSNLAKQKKILKCITVYGFRLI